MQNYVSKFITGSLAALFMIFLSANAVQAQDWQNQNQSQNTQGEQSVVDILENSNQHTVFASLLQETDKLQELRDAEHVTVIAPTDRAFEEMDKDVNELRQNTEDLEKLIENHIIDTGDGAYRGNIYTEGNRGDDNNVMRTEESQNITIGELDSDVIEANNGEVHVVDRVLDGNL